MECFSIFDILFILCIPFCDGWALKMSALLLFLLNKLLETERRNYMAEMDLKYFLSGNKKKVEETYYAPTKSLVDDKGKPVEFKFRPVTTAQNQALLESCKKMVKGKNGISTMAIDNFLYNKKLVCASIVFPDLNSSELQESYGVMGAENLLEAMVDNPGEYADLQKYVAEICGFKSLDEEIETAKNS